MQKVKVKGDSVQKLRVETDGRTDEQTDGHDRITSRANAVGKKFDERRPQCGLANLGL